MKRKITKDAYLGAVAGKLGKAKGLLMHGPLDPKQGILRDELGVQVTFSNILRIAENLYDKTEGRQNFDAVASRIANFSGSGYADVADVATVGAIDVTIMSYANSLVPFLCVDRAMANPVDTIYYNNLVAVNTAGGVNEGDVVQNNFAPPNSNVTLGPANKTSSTTGPVRSPPNNPPSFLGGPVMQCG